MHYKPLSPEQKEALVSELYHYHDTTVQNDLVVSYSEKFNVGPRTFKEQIGRRRKFKESQLDFVINFLLSTERTDQVNARQIFLRLFDQMPETFGYMLTINDALSSEPKRSLFERWQEKSLLEKSPNP